MTKILSLCAAAILMSAGAAYAATEDFAHGNMHFDAKAMDTDHDGMISKDEFMKQHEAMWGKMKKDKDGMISVSSTDFGRGGMHAKEMDANGDGMVTQTEFMAHIDSVWEKITKDHTGQVSVKDMQMQHDKMMKEHAMAKDAAGDSSATK